MTTSQIHQVVQRLRRAVVLRETAGLGDGQLLEHFIARRDEAAFEALVRRHGPMVLGVCLRILRRHADAEDAFQATFLVLARKAASVVPREMVANWLYGVARQTAVKARAVAAKRRAREKQVTAMPEPEARPRDPWEDLEPLLDEELGRLPDKYRVPVVLCDLEGKTRKEAAHQLGWPEGTLSGRLSRARALLAKRLARRGVSLSGGALAAVLTEKAASASVPAPLVGSTVKAAIGFAAGPTAATGLIPVRVALLTEGVLKTMLLNRLKTTLTALLAAGLLGAGLGLGGFFHPARAGDEQPIPRTNGAPAPMPQTAGPIPPAPAKGEEGQAMPKAFVIQMQLFEGGPDGKVHALTPHHRHALSGGKSDTVQLAYKERLQDFAGEEKAKLFDRTIGVERAVGFVGAGRETVKSGIFYEVKVRGMGPDRVLLNLFLQKDDAEQADAEGTVIRGRTLKVIRQIKIGNLERFALEKDGKGRPVSWLEVSVILDPGFTPTAEPSPAPRPEPFGAKRP
jgi:RNA polymerase sigma factor (sigma-70 family)